MTKKQYQQFQRTRYITKLYENENKYWIDINAIHFTSSQKGKQLINEEYERIIKKNPNADNDKTLYDNIRDTIEIDYIKRNTEHYKEVERDWKVSQPHHNSEELCKIYGVSPEFAKTLQIKNLKNQLDKIYNTFDFWNNKKSNWFVDWRLEQLRKKMNKLENRIKFLSSHQQHNNDSFDLETIKAIPIMDILNIIGVEAIENKIICPFHDDKNPSCYIYEKTNSFFCFSCNTGGDNISLIMELKQISFRDACQYLSSLTN